MIRHYLTFAIRNLLKHRTQNLISIAGLGVCMLCFSLCLYCSRFILGIDRCFDNREALSRCGNLAGLLADRAKTIESI